MKQHPLVFGKQNNLVGVYTEAHAEGRDSKTAFILWNTGVGSRIGHYRGNTELARVIAKAGYPSLRFDLSSRGDSDQRPCSEGEQERNTLDVCEAMDTIQEQFAIERFVLIGICSGAVDIHHVVLRDQRIHGFVMVDTYIHPTPKFRLFYYLKRISIPRMLSAVVKRLRPDPMQEEEEVENSYFGFYPSVDEIRAAWKQFMQREIKTLVIFTGGFDYIYSYRDQFRDMLGEVDLRNNFSFYHLPEADHVFSLLEQRQNFQNILGRWIDVDLFADKAKTIEQVVSSQNVSQPRTDPVEQLFVDKLTKEGVFSSEQIKLILDHFRSTLDPSLLISEKQSDTGQPQNIAAISRQEEFGEKSEKDSTDWPWQLPPVENAVLGRDEHMNPAWFIPDPNTENQWLLLNEDDPHDMGGQINSTMGFTPEEPSARLGRDPDGNPAWFIPDPNREGYWVRIDQAETLQSTL